METGSQAMLSDRFREALGYCFDLHRRQVRKGTPVPYISHLMAVASLVLENGGDEDTAIAALLHDAVEDQGGRETLDIIRSRFGERVADIVRHCSDSDTTPKPPWKERKEKALRRLEKASPEEILVVLADKTHNARSIVVDLHRSGPGVWDRFQGGRDGTLWYYKAVLQALTARKLYPVLLQELASLVRYMESYGRFEASFVVE